MSRAEWSRLMKADAPPYAIANNNVRLPLSFRTLPTTARHFDGTLQYDAHNLYGLSQAAVTARALRRVFAAKAAKGGRTEEEEESGRGAPAATAAAAEERRKKKPSLFSSLFSSSRSSSAPPSSPPSPSSSSSASPSYSRRPFVLTRSSFLGAGAHSAHWLGDNAATWEDLRWSVAGVLEAGLYGNPLPGADVCGFLFDTTPELCARWIAAGSFHPFVRDHSDLMAAGQELYRWPQTARAARRALGARYRLLPYLYTGSAAAARRARGREDGRGAAGEASFRGGRRAVAAVGGACGDDAEAFVGVETGLIALLPASLRNCIVDRAASNRNQKKRSALERGECGG